MSAIPPTAQPAVLFVRAKNGGKSQMAAGLMKLEAGAQIGVTSAGTKPGAAINDLWAEVLLDLGIDISAEKPKVLTEQNMRAAGLVVARGTKAKVPAIEGVRIEIWETYEPSLHGLEGRERMEFLRDDIHVRVKDRKNRRLTSR